MAQQEPHRRHAARDSREARTTPAQAMAMTHGLVLTIQQQDREIERLQAGNIALLDLLAKTPR